MALKTLVSFIGAEKVRFLKLIIVYSVAYCVDFTGNSGELLTLIRAFHDNELNFVQLLYIIFNWCI